ncbi:hypothetical protein VBM90_02975 [Mycoplasma sp. 2704]|uniref:hypothetical protein n=1 Tax=unclassified Mycoplasma TaxID=2683645 RepID=UPI002B1E33D0|nr:hypothetical protein [Mycoplasma sp. 2704]MEA4134746.1 hypothetical protein [Mycoplasma sp. 2704]
MNLMQIETENAFGLKPYVRKDFCYANDFRTSKFKDIFDEQIGDRFEMNVIKMLEGSDE